MKNLQTLTSICVLLCLSITADAALFKLEYSGHLTDRFTPGYDFDDYINGTLMFDLAMAEDVYPGDKFYSEYQIIPGASDFVTGYVTPNEGINHDFVRVNNGYGEPDNPEPHLDSFNFYDSNVVEGGIKDAIFVGVYIDDLDWLFNDSVKQFSYTGADLNETSTASITRGIFTNEWGGTYYPEYEAYYLLDFVKLSAIDVPTPTSLPLLLMGGLFLVLRRRVV